MGAKRGAGAAYTSGAPDFTPAFSEIRAARSLDAVFCVVFCRLLFGPFLIWSIFKIFLNQ